MQLSTNSPMSGTRKHGLIAFGNRSSILLLLLALLFSLSGCATISTLSQPVHERKPLLMSGVRLNLAALNNETAVSQRYGVSPPTYPLLDLPFSATFDIMALTYTVPVSIFYSF
ncbi:MAG: YceK/YidQ family lipoprotein [Granulosicoccus sp.]